MGKPFSKKNLERMDIEWIQRYSDFPPGNWKPIVRAAELLGLEHRTVRNLVHERKIKLVMLEGVGFVNLSEILLSDKIKKERAWWKARKMKRRYRHDSKHTE